MPAQPKRYTEAEYLQLERASSIKHEFYQGRIYAMTGASRTHNLIVSNTLADVYEKVEFPTAETRVTRDIPEEP